MLRHDCDYKNKNCADCAEYRKFITNEYKKLKKYLGEFFTLADRYATSIAKLRYEIELDDIIFSGHEEEYTDLTAAEVEEHAKAVTKALEVLEAYSSKHNEFFHTEYDEVLTIRESVYQIYRKVLRKYYKAMMIIFGNSTDLAKQALDCVREAIATHLES
jgi:predicted translin family RNA/ssDNA-binding protein